MLDGWVFLLVRRIQGSFANVEASFKNMVYKMRMSKSVTDLKLVAEIFTSLQSIEIFGN